MWPRPWESDPPLFNCRWGQFSGVVRDARRLLPIVPSDEPIMPAAVWLQNRLQPLCDDDDRALRAADSDRSHLADESAPPANVSVVAEALARHFVTTGGNPGTQVQARKRWDLEKLPWLGAGTSSNDSVPPCRCSSPGRWDSKRSAWTGRPSCPLIRAFRRPSTSISPRGTHSKSCRWSEMSTKCGAPSCATDRMGERGPSSWRPGKERECTITDRNPSMRP